MRTSFSFLSLFVLASAHATGCALDWDKQHGDADAGDLFDASTKTDANTPGDGTDAASPDAANSDDAASSDAASSDAASSDGSPDASGPKERAVFTPGEACEEEEALACGGDDSTVVLVCTGHVWTQAAACAENQRCDGRLGATQGQCTEIVAECIDKSPGAAFCRDGERFSCGTDRVTAESVACDSGYTCKLEGDQAICVDVDECAAGTQVTCGAGASGCTNADGTFSCACKGGYTAPAAGGACTDIDECEAGLTAACGAGAKACSNTVGGYNCTCDALYKKSGGRCVSKQWGEAKKIGTNAGLPTSAPAVAVNASGNAIVTWSQYNSDASKLYTVANRYTASSGQWTTSPQLVSDGSRSSMNPTVVLDSANTALVAWAENAGSGAAAIMWSRCIVGGACSTPATLEGAAPYIGGVCSALSIASNGDVLAVYPHKKDTVYEIQARRFNATTGTWSAGTSILSTLPSSGSAIAPAVALAANGDAIAIWTQTGTSTASLLASRFTASNSKWSAYTPLATDVYYPYRPSIGVDSGGNALATYFGTTSASYLRYSTATGWDATASALSDGSGQAAYPSVAVHSSKSAMLAWSQTNGATFSVVAKRYLASSGQWDASTTPLSAGGSALDVAVAMDPNGNVVAVWLQREGDTNNYSLWAAVYN